MTLAVRFESEAEEEVAAAAIYYELRQPGLGGAFLHAIDEAVGRIRENPRLYSSPPEVDPLLGVRRILIRRFPFSLVYVELANAIQILAVAHASKRPGYWRPR